MSKLVLKKLGWFGLDHIEAQEIIGMLKVCIKILEIKDREKMEQHIASVSWRLADCGGMVREMIEKSGQSKVCGYDVKTGRGYMLPGGKK